ncbi:MAG: neutral/alkaline non-lysosomal ceramidase N-terminal domain-containing protein [Anditalea sp.]
MKILTFILMMISSFLTSSLFAQSSDKENQAGWKAGVAQIVITPEEPLWMAGFAARKHPAEGKLHDLWIKALALEDATGKQAVLVTADLLGLPKNISDRIRQMLETQYGLSKAQIILNSSHTHSAPVLQNALSDIYPLDDQQIKQVEEYSEKLVNQMVTLVGNALKVLQPVELYAGNGVSRFQVNRRNNDANTLDRVTELYGPSDYAVPVIKVVNGAGDILAITFGYACHPTVLSEYYWSGDYPGFAQLELEKLYPGATAMFFQGAGADQNPLPRRTIPLAEQYGKTLAAAVDRVLHEDMRKLEPQLQTAYSEVDLPLTTSPTIEELTIYIENSSGYQQRWASRLLENLQQGESFNSSYPYPLQVWQLGDQPIMTLGGELVVEYAIQLKKIFGPDIFVMGYSNDVMAYIPSITILREGGYEGATSQMVYGLPSTWASNIETLILHELIRLAEQAGVGKPESKLID